LCFFVLFFFVIFAVSCVCVCLLACLVCKKTNKHARNSKINEEKQNRKTQMETCASRQTHTQETAKLTKKNGTGKQKWKHARKGNKPAKQIPSGI
jgi:hypothetical protein